MTRKLTRSSRHRPTGFIALVTGAALAAAALLAPPAMSTGATVNEVAFVTRTVPVPGADAPIIARLESLGWTVRPVDDDRVRASGLQAVSGADVVLVSSTVYVPRIATRLSQTTMPVVIWEPALYDDFGLTTGASGTAGEASLRRSIDIVDAGHPIAAGLSGVVDVSTKDRKVSYARVGPAADVIATLAGDATKSTVFAYAAGAALPGGGTAAGPRVGLYLVQNSSRAMSASGWSIFDAAIGWATGQPSVPGAATPTTTTISEPAPAPPAPAPPAPAPPAPGGSSAILAPKVGTHFGAFVSKRGTGDAYDSVVRLEQSLGRQFAIINRFHTFSSGVDSSFHFDRAYIADGRIVMMSWRATDNPNGTSGTTDSSRAKKIVAGQFDKEIRAMAQGVKGLNAKVLIRFNWEMDQSPGSAQYIGTPAEFIAAWRYVHDFFVREGATNAVWVWAPRAASFNKGEGQKFYPGDAYVDWIGASAVPINSFRDAVTIYGDWYNWASQRGKPMLLWVGLRENPTSAQWKAGFLKELDGLISGPWSQVKATVYYHSNSPKGYDYWADTSTASWNAFKAMGCNPHFATNDTC